MLRKLESLIVFLFMALLPSQLAFHFWPDWSFVHGVRVDYLSPTLYFTDLVLLGLFLVVRKTYLTPKLFGIFALIAATNIVMAVSQPLAMYQWLRTLEYIWLGHYVFYNWAKQEKFFRLGLITALIWTSVLAVLQSLLQHSAGGLWYWLGERAFTVTTPGISRITFLGELLVRPYATLPHPNALAAFLLVATILLFSKVKKINMNILTCAVSLFLVMLLTFARSVLFAAGMFVVMLTTSFVKTARWRYLLIGSVIFVMCLFPLLPNNPESAAERITLMVSGLTTVSSRPLFGVGLGSSILGNAETSLSNTNFKLSLQPVHNIYLLLVVELGLVGVAVMVVSLSRPVWQMWKKSSLYWRAAVLLVLVLGLADHYWLTLHQTSFILAVFLGVVALQSVGHKEAGE